MAHSHGHDHGPANYGRAFAIGTVLNLGFVIGEVVFGLRAHSLALIADAGHNLGDVLGLLLAWGATVLAQRRATVRHTYGFRRSTILAALANGIILLIATGGIAWEAIQRLSHPMPVAGTTVIGVAAGGIVINGLTAFLFMAGRSGDLNIRGAFLHMAADAVVAAGVVIAGTMILYTGWTWLDPVASLGIGVVIIIGTWTLLCDSMNLALDAVPEGIRLIDVETYLTGLPGVAHIHDLHIWGMSTTETALTAHLVIPDGPTSADAFLVQTATQLHDQFGIEHTTVQVETGDPAYPCRSCAPLAHT